ncbi:SDR family oxidoreductase [Actinomycetospora sp. CA-084318]|uniref:SDR family oxidoreductase n=1 Tax=Actinomycetospora sp. CA-084318 TaxID=3239892 RepID=UPI003D993546
MRIVVVGGTGLVGSTLVELLRRQGHDVVAASPSTGVDTVTREGLAETLTGADAVVDLTNRTTFEPGAITDFFTTSTRNLLEAERHAGVGHHVVLSIVGVDRISHPGYLDAKAAQERLVTNSGVPFTIVRATQFFEFLTTIGAGLAQGDEIVLPAADLQPIAVADVAAALADVVTAAPLGGVVEIAGPERGTFARFVDPALRAHRDERAVRSEPDAGYFGVPIVQDSLVPLGPARIGSTTFEDWSVAPSAPSAP